MLLQVPQLVQQILEPEKRSFLKPEQPILLEVARVFHLKPQLEQHYQALDEP